MTEALSKHLLIQSPSEITQTRVWSQLERDYMSAAPPFRFRRSREVDASALAWMGALWDGDAADDWQQKNAVQSVRYLLETIWVSNPEAARDTVALKARNNIKTYPDQPLPGDHPDWLPELIAPMPDQSGVAVQPGAVIAVAHPNGETGASTVLYYMLETHDEEPFGADSFPNDGDAGRYDTVWKERVHSVRRVYPAQGGQSVLSEHEYLDLGVGAILQRYPFLESEQRVTTSLRNRLETMMADEATNYPTLRALTSEIQGLNKELAWLRRSVSGLIGYAASKGYTLLDAPTTVTPTIRGMAQAAQTFQPGDMFQAVRFTTRWVEEHLIHRSRRRFLRSTKRWTEVRRINRSAEDAKYVKIESNDAMLGDFVQYRLAGKNAVILESVAGGYAAQDGRSLEAVLERCEIDPDYQAKCVLLMPVYRQSLFGEDIVAGYHVIHRPKRGRRIVAMPEFYLEEQISYKLRWLGMELGELLSSVNLLPGEVRDISIKTTRSSLHEEELKSVQSLEAEASSSFDTVSSVENEFQRENTSEKTRSWSVKASGSYGAFSTGGDASGTSRQTARQFAKSLNKLTTQALSKMRKSSRSEVVAHSLSREEMEAVSSASGQVSNPNVGRTLNVNYFAINNVFASSTYLDDIGFSYISPFELIDGTDIREVRSFSKEELPAFLDTVRRDIGRMVEMGMEFSPDLARAGAHPTRAKVRAEAAKLAGQFVIRLKADFLVAFGDYSTDRASIEDAAMETEPVEAFMVKEAAAAPRAVDPTQDDDLERMIERLVATGQPIEPDVVISPSAAVYADASTGATEGLEGYAVDMRRLEVEKQIAEIVSSMTKPDGPPETQVRTHHNVSHRKSGAAELTVTIGGTPAPGPWRYRIGGAVIGTIDIVEGNATYTLALPEDAPGNAMIAQLPGSIVRYV